MNLIISACRQWLRELGAISDTKFLMSKLRQMGVAAQGLNEYSLKQLLLENDGFVGYLKFQVGLDEFGEKSQRKNMFQIVHEVLDKAVGPLTARQIWREIRKHYGYPEYAVSQKLYYTPEFIRVGTATYALPKHIRDYDNIAETINNFAREWILTKKRPISAFLVTEALRGAEVIPNLPDGLADHVLSVSSGFVKLRKGYFDLAGRTDRNAGDNFGAGVAPLANNSLSLASRNSG
jgi:hypothetical protein